MSSNPRRTKPSTMKENFDRSKKFLSKTFRNLKSYLIRGSQNLSKNPDGEKPNPKLDKLENFNRNLSKRWESNEVGEKKMVQFSPKEQRNSDEQCSNSSFSFEGSSRFNGFIEDKGSKYSGRIKEEPSFLDAEALAKKMKELEMMDVSDMDQVLDVEEVLHYYSRLTCPTYLEMVDKFFTGMYSELRRPEPSRNVNGSMRKLESARLGSARMGSHSVHSSMRSFGPVKI